MAEPRQILKVLAGPNAGAQATLGTRTVVGSAETADVTIADPDLAAQHFTLQVDGAAVSLVVGESPVTVDGKPHLNETVRLAAFDLIKFGITTCAVGPEDAAWPAFDPADLLPARNQAPAAAVPVLDKVVPERGTALPPASPGARSRIVPIGLAVLVLLALLGGGAFWLFNQSSISIAAHSPQEIAQQIATSLGTTGVKVREDEQGNLIVEGYVTSNEQQRRLRQALADAGVAARNNVVSLEQQVTAIRTIVGAAGAKLTVEPDPATGKIVVEGFLPEMAHWDTLQRVLARDVPDLRPIEAHIVTTEKAVAEARERLDAAGLAKTTHVDASGATVRISGAVPESQRGAVKRIAEELTANWARSQIKVEDATTSLTGASPTPTPTLIAPSQTVTVRSEDAGARFTIIVAGKDGFVRDNSGRRYGVGDRLANGEVIREIRVDEVVTSRDGVKYRYTFGGR